MDSQESDDDKGPWVAKENGKIIDRDDNSNVLIERIWKTHPYPEKVGIEYEFPEAFV